MKMKHMLIEGFCDGENKKDIFPCKTSHKVGVHCFECPMFSYTYCPYELAISDEDGSVEESIGFGGDMEPIDIEKRKEYIAIWKDICKEKINEAYEQYKTKCKIDDIT